MAALLRMRALDDYTFSHAISNAVWGAILARQLGFRDWNTCHAELADETPEQPVIPILRTFPGEAADRFYLEYLGCTVDWEHRFEPGLPLYRQLRFADCLLHLSEHHGDATPGSAVRIAVSDVAALHRRLRDTEYPLRPGIEQQPWGAEVTLTDPFGNRLILHQPN